MKTAKNGGAKSARAQEIKSETKKMLKLFRLSPDSLDRHAAYRRYCKAVERAMSEAPIWREDVIRELYPIVLRLQDEADLSALTDEFYEAQGQVKALRKQIKARVRCSK